MAMNIPVPIPMNLSLNLASEWRRFKDEFENYEIASGLVDNPTGRRAAILLSCIGSEAHAVFRTLDVPEADRKKVEKVTEALERHFIGQTNEIYERYKLYIRSQETGESFDSYFADLRTLIKTCNYGAVEESILRDKIVFGIQNDAVKRRLLETRNLTLNQAIDMCRANETASNQLKVMSSDDVNAVSHKPNRYRSRSKSNDSRSQYNRQDNDRNLCKYCGSKHEPRRCPAFGKTCNICKKQNHFAAVCQSRSRHRINELSTTEVSDQAMDAHIHSVRALDMQSDQHERVLSLHNADIKRLYSHLDVSGKPVRFLLDGGSTVNLIPRSLAESLSFHLRPPEAVLEMFDNKKLDTCGMTSVEVRHPITGQCRVLDFYVTNVNKQPLLGLQSCLLFDLLTVREENICSVTAMSNDKIKEKYADLFEGYGLLEGKVRLEVDNSVTPVRLPLRKLPIPIKDKVEKEIQTLKENNIIREIIGPTPWISALLVVNKPNGDVRICIDPKPLNKALKRDHYPMPTIDDVLPNLSQAKIFSTIDAKSGFWHCELDDESSKLTTFETPFGKFRWLRMPFGISPAPEIFQRKMHEALNGLSGIACIADDILIYGRGESNEEARRDHDNNLVALLERCREKGIKLNKDKMRLHCRSVKFMGHEITADGMKSDPKKIESITKMPQPTDKQAVQRFLGMATYLSRYIPNYSEISAPLRELTRRENEFHWDPYVQGKSFDEIKRMIAMNAVLTYYDVDKPAIVQCDSSKNGLGGVLMQDGKIVECVSRSLTNTEQQYAQIEKELLAIVYTLERLHTYVYGRFVTVETDHKPLISIMKKPLTAAPKRLQRMLLRLQRYNFELIFKPGTAVILADTLSRAFLNTNESTKFSEELASLVEEDIKEELRMVAYDESIRKLKSAAKEDETYQLLIQQIRDGWPENTRTVPRELKEYLTFVDELAVYDGLVYKGIQVVVPGPARSFAIEKIHSSHIGINGCIRRAKEAIFWPGMSSQIKAAVERCPICQEHQRSQVKEPLASHAAPERPWQKVGIDLFSFRNYNYLITVDYLSNYFEIDKLPTKRVCDIVYALKCQFARHGIPDIVFSDNSPFNSREFKVFAANWEFEHHTSSPRYPQSNGKVENAVKTAKTLMQKACESNSDPHLALLDWRNTPSEQLHNSPTQILFGRRTRTRLPMPNILLKTPHCDQIQKNLETAKSRQAHYYNRNTRPREPLEEGTTVRFKNTDDSEWRKGQIVTALPNRSYEIQAEDGSIKRRTSKHVRISSEPPIILNDSGPANHEPRNFHPQDEITNDIERPHETGYHTTPISTTLANEHQTQAENHVRDNPTVTRYGRTVRKPVRYRDIY